MADRDRDIREAVGRTLAETNLLRDGVNVRVEEGVVTLTGTVATIEEKTAVKNTLHRVPGVLDVADDLDVRTSAPRARPDAAIAREARAHLRDLLGEQHVGVHLTVADGCLRCEGRVSNATLRQEVAARLRTVGGLHALINCIEVAPGSEGGPGAEGARET